MADKKNQEKLIEEISKLSVLEVSELVKALEEKFGVSAAPALAAVAPSEGGSAEATAEEKTEFDVVITSAGDNKIAAIKIVREIKPDLGLVEAKELVEKAPVTLLEKVKKEEAEATKKKLEDAGVKVELK
ncbi:50S ribosomal protein L7/L12 [Patescibacteria group bacterium]|nr:50S ribosomal protein L7/L12 [Patescibacteria group bacterium]MBU1256593.1 50S ribosomal protein L7/L12 [Patescibacteria group bacterium]MBU1457920.1 50S ribosomal protein L7/L12 [Patescibacteria group bacterium]